MRKWLLAGALVLALPFVMADSCGGAGGAPAGSNTASVKPVAVGTAMKNTDGLSVTVVSFKRGFSTGNEFDAPKSGNEYVQVTFKFVNGSKSQWSSPLTELSLIDANGQ